MTSIMLILSIITFVEISLPQFKDYVRIPKKI